jgi:hypothetical protein
VTPPWETALQEYERYSVSAARRKPILRFMLDALEAGGCRIIHEPQGTEAPFRITFETPSGERLGVIAYAFTANSRLTRNRPADEHRFQMKYGAESRNASGRLHELWQDPYGLYTTLLVGIDPDMGIFVGADPVLHSPTRFFISIEFKREQVQRIMENEWHAWERERRKAGEPIEVLVGGTRASFLRYIRFEREALGEDQGHRQLLAERAAPSAPTGLILPGASLPEMEERRLHALAREFDLDPDEVLDLIAEAPRLKMAVRGWVAEEHLVRQLNVTPGVSECRRLNDEGRPDVELRFEGSRPITIECKNVLRRRTSSGFARLDFQRTRASVADPCSRYYSPCDFDVVAACLHSVTERWEFRYTLPRLLEPHKACEGKLANNVSIDTAWDAPVSEVLRAAARV